MKNGRRGYSGLQSREEAPTVSTPLLECVAISVIPLNDTAMFVTDSLYNPVSLLNVEVTRLTDSHASDMDALLLAGWHGRLYDISGLKTKKLLLTRQLLVNDAATVRPSAEAAAPSISRITRS